MKKLKGQSSLIITVVIVLTVMAVALVSGDYFFDLNDDVLMKDILSGAYTGAPEGHNIQMLYPISLFISLFYRFGINVDWYGIFLCGCQYFCIGAIAYKSISMAKEAWKKALIALTELVFVLGFYLPHLLFVQYTVVCGLLSATAAFFIITADIKQDDGTAKKDMENSLALFCIGLAYLIRSEMLLLTLPMVGVALLIKFLIESNESGQKSKVFNLYMTFFVSIVVTLIVATLLHKLAYSSADWKEFNRFFDNRTELYDFQYVPDYDENREFYESIGLTKSQQQLLVNYNFGLDDSIDADVLGEIASYAKEIKGQEAPFLQRLMEAAKQYLYRLRHVEELRSYEYPMTDFPWNICVIILYIGVFVSSILGLEPGIIRKSRVLNTLFFLLTLLCCRTALWLFIIMRERDPIRITHPLYLVEILVLFGLLMSKRCLKNRAGNIVAMVTTFVVLIIGASALPMQVSVTSKEQEMREEMLANYGQLEDYVRGHEDAFFFYDVYTSVSYASVADYPVSTYSEKMFGKVNNSCYNRDIMGGWASKSPLSVQKYRNAGFTDMSLALLASKVYFVQNKTEDVDWLISFYADKGIAVEVEKTDLVADIFAIYKVSRTEETNEG